MLWNSWGTSMQSRLSLIEKKERKNERKKGEKKNKSKLSHLIFSTVTKINGV